MDEETNAAFEAAQSRIQEIQDKLDAALEGNKTWTEAQIATFQQTLVDLRTELNTISVQSATTLELREQLILMQQEVEALKLKEAETTTLLQSLPKKSQSNKPEKVDDPKAPATNNRQRPVKYL